MKRHYLHAKIFGLLLIASLMVVQSKPAQAL